MRAAGRREAVTYATPAVASPHHMAMELLRRRAGFEAAHVPYRHHVLQHGRHAAIGHMG
ncbi:hypothetical protein, partial [Bilophila wadsworthia]|uniref:hypothetical protein n=1 Tax=Bilophila wadsworthia TaxID=35833 RepID=UPI003B585CA1